MLRFGAVDVKAYTLSLFDLPNALMMLDDGEENFQALIYACEGACNPFCLLIWNHKIRLTITTIAKSTGFVQIPVMCFYSDVFRD